MIAWDFLRKLQSSYEFDFTSDREKAILTNRLNGRSVVVFEERLYDASGDAETEYIVSFTTQHRHIDDPEDAQDHPGR